MAVLFIGPTRLGDGILASGVLARLGETAPGRSITLACGMPASMALRNAPGVEELHIIRKRAVHGHWLDLWRAVAWRRWDRVIDLRRSVLPWLLRAGSRQIVPLSRPDEHRVALAARTIGLPPQAPRIWITEADRGRADRLVPQGAPILALGVGANWVGKIWPATQFADLAVRLTATDGPLSCGRVLLVGSDTERALAGPVFARFAPHRVIDAFGLDISTTAASLERADLFVGNDSAMMHLAAATGTRTVGLFGPTDDALYGPWGSNALAVRTPETATELRAMQARRPDAGSLMTSLRHEAVAAAIARRWDGPRRGEAG